MAINLQGFLLSPKGNGFLPMANERIFYEDKHGCAGN